MDLDAKLARVTDAMRSTKEGWVESSPDSTDLAIYIHVWRGDDLVVTLISPMDRDTGLKAAHMAAMGFNADTVAITFESYHSTLEKSPITGETWQHHEMQFVFETVPDSVEKGWVCECLTTTIHDRDDNCLMSSLAYAIKEGKLQWLGDDEWLKASHDGGTARGFMYEMLSQAMKNPKMDDTITEEGPLLSIASSLVGDDEEIRHYHMDVACLHALMDKGLITASIVHAKTGSLREKWLTERFGAAAVHTE